MSTYTITKKTVFGNQKVNFGIVDVASGLVTAYVPTALRVCEHFVCQSLNSGTVATAVYPTTYPADVSNTATGSGAVTVIHASGADFIWAAYGR